MHTFLKLLILTGLLTASFASAQNITEPSFYPNNLNRVSDANLNHNFVPTADAFRGGIVGLMVVQEDGTSVVEYNADTRLMPASNQKLFSVIYALDHLSADQTFTTQISATRDKWLIQTPFSGTITLAQWKELVILAKKNSKSGNPKKVEVQQLFKVGIPDGWELDDLITTYAAPIQSLSFDLGRAQLFSKNGFLETIPKEFGIKFKVERVAESTPSSFSYNYLDRLLIQIGLTKAKDGLYQEIALPHPDEAAAMYLAPKITFTVLDGIENPITDSTILASYITPNVGELASLCLQPSDNQLAETFLLLGAATEGSLGKNPHAMATSRISKWLERIGISSDEARPQDGSGLSRHNLTSPRALIKLLTYAKSKPWFPVLELALARPGVGTLKSRLAGTSFRGKTGTLDAVVGLSGFVTSKSGEEFIFSCLVNHASGNSSQVRSGVDDFVRTLENTSSIGNNVAYHD